MPDQIATREPASPSGIDTPNFGLYQIYFHPKQRRLLDSAFIPYENIENHRPEWREFHVFRKEWLAGTMEQHDYTGFFSWKFRQKARVPAQTLIDFALANPGAEVYFINPFPDKTARFANVWLHGEVVHPGIISAAERLLERFGTPRRLTMSAHSSSVVCYCNYWFATKAFWKAYMEFCLPIYEYIEHHATVEEADMLWAPADRSGAPLVAYIFERLFTEFIVSRPELKACAFRYSGLHLERRYNEHFPALFQGSEALKRAFERSQDPDLLAGISAYGEAMRALNKGVRRRRRWTTIRGMHEWMCKLTGRNPPVLPE